jgi:hypothetical protein
LEGTWGYVGGLVGELRRRGGEDEGNGSGNLFSSREEKVCSLQEEEETGRAVDIACWGTVVSDEVLGSYVRYRAKEAVGFI